MLFSNSKPCLLTLGTDQQPWYLWQKKIIAESEIFNGKTCFLLTCFLCFKQLTDAYKPIPPSPHIRLSKALCWSCIQIPQPWYSEIHFNLQQLFSLFFFSNFRACKFNIFDTNPSPKSSQIHELSPPFTRDSVEENLHSSMFSNHKARPKTLSNLMYKVRVFINFKFCPDQLNTTPVIPTQRTWCRG